jgi:hypothetical protein
MDTPRVPLRASAHSFATVSHRRPPPSCNVLVFNRLIWLVKNHPTGVTEDNHSSRCCLSPGSGQRAYTPSTWMPSPDVSIHSRFLHHRHKHEHGRSWEADSHSAGQLIPRIYGARNSIIEKNRPASSEMTPCCPAEVNPYFGEAHWPHLQGLVVLLLDCFAHLSNRKQETVCSSETSVNLFQITEDQTSKGSSVRKPPCENHRSNMQHLFHHSDNAPTLRQITLVHTLKPFFP